MRESIQKGAFPYAIEDVVRLVILQKNYTKLASDSKHDHVMRPGMSSFLV